MLLLQGFIFAILVFIAWQDFKFRAVYWWLFVTLLIALTGLKITHSNWQTLVYDLKCNVMFLGVQLLFLTLYFSIKEKKMVNIFHSYFGLGDLFFLLSITTYFSFFNYVVYYLISLFVIILMSIAVHILVKSASAKIPLAGEQALLLMVFMLVDGFVQNVNLTTDLGLINYFSL
ncbi:hypothetical protein FA048_19510 [Pedobacter polaris]|uniref:Prepilin type IV endopeptidase peptidase domain-containing protein n=1 Tax=Pedobacter polaris TaxID=2571273 RepID=A0A4U1CHA6_9SPHI|nr:hypothetical protein [Pedobacter polaris]TKC04529.1 hypothetical protein FA048_19510 [Pedobacter polaris]